MNFLKFDETRDFPYYRHNPRISKSAWLILLLLCPVIFLISSFIDDMIVCGAFACFGILIPLLYFSKWNYNLIFHKPSKDEFILGFLMFVSYIVYVIVIGYLLDPTGLIDNSNTYVPEITLDLIISLFFSLMAEELIKFIPLMFFLRLFFKYTYNKKLSIAMSAFIVMMYFGVLHYDFESPIFSFIIMQGFGTIFEMIGYIKTKNLFVPYISHTLTDLFIYAVTFLGIF